MKRKRERLDEIVNGLHFEGAVVTNPQRCQAAIKKIERNAANTFKLRLVDPWIEIRIDGGLGNTELVGVPEDSLWYANLDLIFSHSQMKAQQFSSSGQLHKFLRALTLSVNWSGAEEPDQQKEGECSPVKTTSNIRRLKW